MSIGVPLCQQVGAGDFVGGEKTIEIDHSVVNGIWMNRVGGVLSLDSRRREVDGRRVDGLL